MRPVFVGFALFLVCGRWWFPAFANVCAPKPSLVFWWSVFLLVRPVFVWFRIGWFVFAGALVRPVFFGVSRWFCVGGRWWCPAFAIVGAPKPTLVFVVCFSVGALVRPVFVGLRVGGFVLRSHS